MSFPILLLAAAAGQAPPAPPPALAEYVRKPDPSFAWAMKGQTDTPAGTAYELAVTSQTWQGIPWKHAVQVFVPAGAKPTDRFVLWNQGGGPSSTSSLLGVLLCEKIKAPVVFLYGVPNQPIFGKTEDGLIAETFVRYLETGDATWPLLFPMVKSVTAAMDAVQQFAAKQWAGHKVSGFVVTGASKRGWTSWLAAASGDPRVVAVAPLVIDTLNMRAQMPNQVRAFGGYSAMIRDYTERKLVPVPDTPAAQKLWAMVDPWVYRKALTVPKMIINGANDPYWALDALNLYWDDLPGEKRVLYVPNAGHGLQEAVDAKGRTSRDRAINTLCAFCRSQVRGTPLPQPAWEYQNAGDAVALRVTPNGTARAVRVWQAESPTRDFRKATWKPAEADANARTVAPAAGKFVAFFGEVEYADGADTFTLSTQPRILEPAKP